MFASGEQIKSIYLSFYSKHEIGKGEKKYIFYNKNYEIFSNSDNNNTIFMRHVEADTEDFLYGKGNKRCLNSLFCG